MLAGTNTFVLLLVGAFVVVGGLIIGYVLTRAKKVADQTTDNPADTLEQVSTKLDHPQHMTTSATDAAARPASTTLESVAAVAPPINREPEPEETVEADDNAVIKLGDHLLSLTPQIKHRIIYRFMPHLKGMLFEGDTLDGYLGDAVSRAAQKGWDDDALLAAAQSGKWKKPRVEQ